MNFAFSDDQEMLRDQARRFLADKVPLTAVRRVLEGEAETDRDAWAAMVEMGWTATLIPEAYGGLGLGPLELCVLAEELGRSLAPVPFAASVYLFTQAILKHGTPDQQKGLLPLLATGEAIGTLAHAEGASLPTAETLACTVMDSALSGTKTAVPEGTLATHALVSAKNPDGTLGLYIADLTGPGVKQETVKIVDPTRPHATITFTNAPVEPLGGSVTDHALVLDDIMDRAAVPVAFEAVGGAEACMEMAVAYTKGRYAFGRPVASFQAIKHKCADMYVHAQLSKSNAYYGAWALAHDAPELPVAAAAARVSSNDAYWFCAKENVQAHGGMGFTWEFDCHLYYRRAKVLGLMLGATRRWKDKLVRRLALRNAA